MNQMTACKVKVVTFGDNPNKKSQIFSPGQGGDQKQSFKKTNIGHYQLQVINDNLCYTCLPKLYEVIICHTYMAWL